MSTGGKDAVKSVIGPNHPLKSKIDSYYNSIVSSVQSHVEYPSFMSKSTGKAKTIELEWDGSKYVAELTDTNNVLSKFTFSASATGFNFSVSGNKLTITTDNAPTGDVTITASRSVARCGVLVWTDNKYGPDGGIQDTVTYTASVSDPVKAFIKLKVSYGSAKIIKTSEDGKVDGIKFALSQIGNVGGEPYWSWYGFGSRGEWCACFVSWCADQCGYIETGVCPKYAGCVNGVSWFKEHNQWVDGSETPSPGMIIFYDWDSPNGSSGPQDGLSDHTGIVERVENGIVYTVEGNSGDSCRQCHRAVGNYEILGYGVLIP